MGNDVLIPVIAGLTIGAAFVIMFAVVSSSLTMNGEADFTDRVIALQFDDTEPQFPAYDRVKVYIFPRDRDVQVNADDLEWELGLKSGIVLAYGYGDGFGASKLGIYKTNGTLVVPNGTDFYISPDLKKSDGSLLVVEDIHEQQVFGNGIETGDIMLNPKGVGQIGELVPAITLVVAEQDIADADSKIEQIRDSIEDPKLVKITIPEGASIASSGRTYDPQTIKVIIGYNNTVRWVNDDSTYHIIEADDNTDLDFYRKTTYANPDAARRNTMTTGESFVYTFTKTGEIGYHGMPYLRGTVIVLEPEN